MESNNPLAQYFRKPAIYITLPSNGEFWPAGTLEPTETGELPVYPMTAGDEIAYRTPDALFNGQAVVDVIRSCVPNIIDPWQIPTVDLDTILVAIRIASFGQSMPIGTKCPSCSEENTFDLNLNSVLDGLTIPDYHQALDLGNIKVNFKPLSYTEVNKNSMLQFEQQKTLSLIANSEADEEEKMKSLTDMMKRINGLTNEALIGSIESIETPEASVTNVGHIREWLEQADRNVYNRVRDFVVGFREQSTLKPLSITCPDCQHKYEQGFTLDMTSFFAPSS